MSDPIVKLESGYVCGLIEKHEDGFEYYAFKGIPYAEPPIGKLRFEDPIAIKQWSGTLDCKTYGPLCSQYEFLTKTFHFDEDCLHLNVFTRTINQPNVKKAVMVWIPLGNFVICNATDSYNGKPDYLIRKNIVLITVSFRIGVLGFLNLEDEVAPGNQGLKDLIMALQWIQQNIQMFGGDRDNVTLCGSTQGGSAAHLLAMSPLTKGLIHKIICHSGTAYNPWATVVNPRTNVLKLCSMLGKDLEDSNEIKSFLKTIDTADLIGAFLRLWKVLDLKPFGPGIDSKSANPIIPIDRYILADQGIHIPCLVGCNNRDGLSFLSDDVSFKDITRAEYFSNCNKDFRKILQYNVLENLDRYNLSPTQIRRLYYKNQIISEDNMDNYVDFATDMFFHLGIHRFVKIQAEQSSAPTYLYKFNYDSTDAFHNVYVKDVPAGATVGDELSYLFKMDLLKQQGVKDHEIGTSNYKMMEQMTEMWTNFAIHARPTIETSELLPIHWKPISNGVLLRYMNIDDDLTMQYTVNILEKMESARQIKA